MAGLANVVDQGNNVLVRKYAADGMPVWTKSFNGAAMLANIASAAALTPDGLLVGGATAVTGAGNDSWLRKYSPEGAVMWTRGHAGAAKGHGTTNAVAVATTGPTSTRPAPRRSSVRRATSGSASTTSTATSCGRGCTTARPARTTICWARWRWRTVVSWCAATTAVGIPWSSFLRRYDGDGLVAWTEVDDGPEAAGALCYGLGLASDGDLLFAGATLQAGTREPRLRRLIADGTPLWSTVVVGAGPGASQARCVREAPDGA